MPLIFLFESLDLLADLAHAHGEPLQRFIVLVQEPSAEIGGSATVDDCGAHDVLPLSKRKPFGDAIVDDGLAIAINADNLLAVDPPDRCRVGASGRPHAPHIRSEEHTSE